jgi:hypothetical protein
MRRAALLAVFLALVAGAGVARASSADEVKFACHGIIAVPGGKMAAQIVNPACIGPLAVVATLNMRGSPPDHPHWWVQTVRVYHNNGRIRVQLNARTVGPVKVAYLGFRPGP